MSAFNTYPSLGIVQRAGTMNAAMLERARSYNATSTHFDLTEGAEGSMPGGRGGSLFAKAAYGLQAFMFGSCTTPVAGGSAARAGASCANIDGMVGPNTMRLVRGLPRGATGAEGGQYVVNALVAFADGNTDALDDLTIDDMSTAVKEMGLRAAERGTAPAPAPPSTPDQERPPGGLVLPDRQDVAPPAGEGMNLWLVLGAAAVGFAVLYYATKGRKK